MIVNDSEPGISTTNITDSLCAKLNLELLSMNLFNFCVALGKDATREYVIGYGYTKDIKGTDFIMYADLIKLFDSGKLNTILRTKYILNSYKDDKLFALMTVHNLSHIKKFLDNVNLNDVLDFFEIKI